MKEDRNIREDDSVVRLQMIFFDVKEKYVLGEVGTHKPG